MNVGLGGEKLRRGKGTGITRECMTVGWKVPDNISSSYRDILRHVSLPAGRWLGTFSARHLNSIPVFSVTTHFATHGCVCVWRSAWRDTQVLYAAIQYNYKVCGRVYHYYYYSEVTVVTADKLLSVEHGMQCVADVVEFLIIVDIL